MHKSWGNSIEFNDAADTMGVDVMRWMYCAHKPENNLLFGYHRADETRRHFLIPLWNVYSFFVTYANLDGWQPAAQGAEAQPSSELDRWILARLNQVVARVTECLDDYDPYGATLVVEPLPGRSDQLVRAPQPPPLLEERARRRQGCGLRHPLPRPADAVQAAGALRALCDRGDVPEPGPLGGQGRLRERPPLRLARRRTRAPSTRICWTAWPWPCRSQPWAARRGARPTSSCASRWPGRGSMPASVQLDLGSLDRAGDRRAQRQGPGVRGRRGRSGRVRDRPAAQRPGTQAWQALSAAAPGGS